MSVSFFQFMCLYIDCIKDLNSNALASKMVYLGQYLGCFTFLFFLHSNSVAMTNHC